MERTRAFTPHYDDEKKVGKRIRDTREKAGLSQKDLAFPGCGAAYVSRIERGERVPSKQVMEEIAGKLGVSVDFIAYGHDVDPDVSAAAKAVSSARTWKQRVKAYRDLAEFSSVAATKLEAAKS